MQSLTPYAEERIVLWRRLQQETAGASLSEYFRPTADELRFHLGTALADLRIPWRIDAGLYDLAATAAIDAFVMASLRHRASLPAGELEKVCAAAGNDGSGLRALSWTPPSSVTRASLLRAFHDAVSGHPGLDSGMVASFLGTGRPGRELLKALHGLFARARDEAARSETQEPTPWIVALGLRTLADRLQSQLRAAPVTESVGRWLRGLWGVLLAETTSLAMRESGLAREAGFALGEASGPVERRAALLSIASLGIAPFMGSRGSMLQTGVAVYGFPLDANPPRIEETVARLAAGEELSVVGRELAATLTRREPEAMRRLERGMALTAIRDNVRALARLADLGRAPSVTVPGDGTLQQLASTRDGIERHFAQESRRRALEKAARDAARRAHDEARQRLEALAHAAREYRDDAPADWLGVTETRLSAARGLVVLAIDQLLERHAASAAGYLLERTGEETEGGDVAEYESGRLYLLASDTRPLLKARVGAPQVGHLFCDMKDFTRRTALLKESVIADFLQREFYSPILQAASGLDPGARMPSTTQNVALNNLLGDAVSFSGDIVALVRLNRSIRQILRAYGRRLEQESSQEAVASRIRALESQHRAKRDALARSVRELQARAPQAEPAMRQSMLLRAKELMAEYRRREARFEQERARAAGEKLEAGTFVSWGAAPEVAQFEDAVFGHIKVAIAEKINESARGTARSGGVRAAIEARLERLRRQTGQPLELPFQVLVGQPMSLQLPPERVLAAADLLKQGDAEGARRLIADAALASLTTTGPGELYNGGAAISEEALEAWIAARGDELRTVRLDVPVASLHPHLRQKYFFPADPIRLVACAPRGTQGLEELFVFQGRVLFKGFEATGGLGVWEIIDQGGDLFRQMATHHAAEWFARSSRG